MTKNQRAILRQGRLFYRIKKTECAVCQERDRLRKRIAKTKNYSDKRVVRINRRLVKKCVLLYDLKQKYKKAAKKAIVSEL